MFDSNVCFGRLIATPKTLYIKLFNIGQQSISNSKSADIGAIRLDMGLFITRL